MAPVFRDFSFEPSSRPSFVRDAERAAMNVSPASIPHHTPPKCPSRLPTPPPSMGELAHIFHQQNLRVEVDPAYQFLRDEGPPTPTDDEFPAELAIQSLRPSYSRIDAAALRFQRQANTKMQCSTAYVKDITRLVQRMVEEEDQCNICDLEPASPSSNSSMTDEDEGVDMTYSPTSPQFPPLHSLKFRRSGDRLNTCAAVSKTVRVRRRSGFLKRRST